MVARPAFPTRSANSGEFSPDAEGRIDVKQFYSGARRMKGIEPVPQSGFRRMGGTRRVMKARKPLVALVITAPTLIAGPHVGTQTIWTGVIGGPVACVNVKGFAVSAGAATFSVECQTPAGWIAIGPAFGDWTTAADRTAAFAPQSGRTATSLRIRATFSVAATVAIASVTAWSESGAALPARYASLTVDDGTVYSAFVSAMIADFATKDGFAGAALLPLTTSAMLADMDFYAESDTIGLFHPSNVPTQRILNFGGGHEWGVSAWPYASIPDVDLGGTYVKTADVWEIALAWENNVEMFLTVTVDGEQTPAVALTDAGTLAPKFAQLANGFDWNLFCANLQAAIVALPNVGAGVTVVWQSWTATSSRLVVTFGGALAGSEYALSAAVVNTVKISANPLHTSIGKTAGEPLFSMTKGYPGLAEEVQSRMTHGRIPAVTGATLMSRTGEIFDFNIKGQNDAAARLDRIRAKTSETILAIKEHKYVLVGTDRAIYFVNNRTIERNTPLNFVKASETGIRANTKMLDLDGLLYYVAANGEQLLSLAYDDVSTSYNANPESMLSSHLISGILRGVRQKAEAEQDAAKLWLLRGDGRLALAQMIRNQEITGFCEWLAAGGGLVKEIGVDSGNKLWLTVQRGAVLTHELYDLSALYQDSVTTICDLAGVVSNLPHAGEVWAKADGYILGPFTVDAGRINLGNAYDGPVEVGYWTAPVFETMRQPFVTGNDQIIFRPGRIHTFYGNLIGTQSIAIGANGGAPQDYRLSEATDAVNMAMPPKTKLISIFGMMGRTTGPTLVITQTRPGELRVGDFALGMDL
jgi:hypothetical protein